MDGANRAFVTLSVLAAASYVLLGYWGCGALVAVSTVVAGDGSVGPTGGGPLSLWAAVLLGTLELTVSLAAIISVQRQLVATERLARWVRGHRIAQPARIADVLRHRRLRHRVDVVSSDELLCFTYGFLRPRIVVSRGLVEASTAQELVAVMAHEAYHVRNLDPLKMMVARTLPAAFFFLPVLDEFQRRYLLTRELAADRHAVNRCGVPALAGALVKIASAGPLHHLAAGAALGSGELLSARVAQLETGTELVPKPLAVRPIALSLASVIVLAGVATSVGWTRPDLASHLHAPPLDSTLTLPSAIATAVCVGFWAWVVWRVAKWWNARPRSIDTTEL